MWPPRRMRHLLRRASSSLRFSRRRRDASATGEAMRARVCERTWCRRGVPGKHSPSSVCTEWGPEHTASKALATLGSSHPFLEPGWDLGYGVAGTDKRPPLGNLFSLSRGYGVCVQPCLGLFTAAHARRGPPRTAWAPGRPTPESYLRAPTRLRLDCACASRSRVLSPRAAGGPGPTARAAAISPLRRNSPLRRRRLQTDLQREARGLRLRTVRPTQSLPGIVVSPGPE